jgi:hypothetical protein
VNQFYGHIITGDLSIIQNENLRNIMNKGAKFRDCANISVEKLERSIVDDVMRFKQKWSDKERIEDCDLDQWACQVIQRMRRRINQLRRNREIYVRGDNVMDKTDVKEEIQRLHDNFIITAVDKAANNFSIR